MEMRACPLCKSTRISVQPWGGLGYYCRCNACSAQHPLSSTEREAIEIWNRELPRVPDLLR